MITFKRIARGLAILAIAAAFGYAMVHYDWARLTVLVIGILGIAWVIGGMEEGPCAFSSRLATPS